MALPSGIASVAQHKAHMRTQLRHLQPVISSEMLALLPTACFIF